MSMFLAIEITVNYIIEYGTEGLKTATLAFCEYLQVYTISDTKTTCPTKDERSELEIVTRKEIDGIVA